MNNKISLNSRDKVIKMLRQGKTLKHITKKVGVNAKTVDQIKIEIGIHKNMKLINKVFR